MSKGSTVKLHVDPQPTPRFCKACMVHYAEQELQQSVTEGIIECSLLIGPRQSCLSSNQMDQRGSVETTRPLPYTLNKDLFASLAGGKLFSKLDLAHVY